MEYYLLPVEESEAIAIERALRKINYDVDERQYGAKKRLTKLLIR
jgi:hypothetical protein